MKSAERVALCLRYPPVWIKPAVLLFAFSCLSWASESAWAEEPSDRDEHTLRMEREIQLLHQRNEALEEELRGLREALERNQEASLETPGVAEGEADSSVTGARNEGSKPSHEKRGDRYRGFLLASPDGRHELRIGGRVTTRFTAFVANHPLDREFSVQRARLFADARLFDDYSLRIQVEFSPEPLLKDGYLELNYVSWARLRLGQFKTPFSLEYLESHKYLDFAERSIAVDNMRFTGRDLGAMLHGRVAAGLLEYQFAVLSGAGENMRDDNSAKDLAGRLVLRPFQWAHSEAMSGLQLGVSGTWGDQNMDYSGFPLLTVGGTPFVEFVDGTTLAGSRTRLGTELAWPLGPASLEAEWMSIWLKDFRSPSLRGDFRSRSWYVSASWLLTGEEKPLGQIAPEHPFGPWRGGWGAWELAARYSRFESDEDLFSLGMAFGSSRVGAFSAALSWYLNELLRFTLHYEHAEFSDGIALDGALFTLDEEDVLLLQGQLEF